MFSSQQLVIGWIELAVTGTILLAATQFIVLRLRQPVDRVNLITMSLLVSAVVPLLLVLLCAPSLRLGMFTIDDEQDTSIQVESNSTMQRHVPEPAHALTVQIEPPMQFEEHTAARAAAQDRPAVIATLADNVLPASTTPNSPVLMAAGKSKSMPAGWSIAAAILLVSHSLAIAWFFIQWIVGTIRLQELSRKALNPSQPMLAAWKLVSNGRGGERLLVTRAISAPMVSGLWRPVILIPESIANGDQTALGFCLAHEWSHVSCGDLPRWQLINLCQLAFWYQPLFWMLRRELRICQDLVADDQAIKKTDDQLARIEYSDLLMFIAKGATNPSIAGAMAFYDRSSQLSRRIKTLLTNRQSLQSRSTQAFCWVSGILLFMISMAIGSVRLGTVQVQEIPPKKPAAIQTGDESPLENTNDQVARDSNSKSVRGQVVNEAGKPVPGAKLWLPLRWEPRRTVEATADEAGKFELTCPIDWIGPSFRGSSWTIWAYAPGYSIQSQSVYEVVRGESNKEYKIQLPPASDTRLKVLTPNGQPLGAVLVKPHDYETSVAYELVPEEMLAFVSARTADNGLVDLPAIQSGPMFRIETHDEEFGRQIIRVDNNKKTADHAIRLRPIASIKGRLTSEDPEWVRNVKLTFITDNQDEWKVPQGMAETVTDNDGNFQVPKIASGGPLHSYVHTDPALPVRPVLSENVFLTAGETVELEIPLLAAPTVRGKVVAKSTRKPVANAEIFLFYGSFHQNGYVTTDENGEYQGRVLPGGVRVHIFYLPDGFVQLGLPWDEPYQVLANVDSFELPTIEVVGSHEIKGLLLGANDQAIPNVQVSAMDGNRRYGSGTSDAEGRFKMSVPDGIDTRIEVYLKDRWPEPVQVIQRNPLVVRYSVDDREEAWEEKRTLRADVTLSGRVLIAGEPVADVQVVLKRGVPVPTMFSEEQSYSTRYGPITETRTDASGNYRLNGLKAGDEYQIEIDPPFPATDPKWHHQSPYFPNLPDTAKGEVVLPDVMLLKLTQ